MVCIKNMDVRKQSKAQIFKRLRTSLQYLEEVMNCGSFKLLHKHVVANGNVFISHRLLESVLGETFTSKEGHWTTVKRANRRRLGRIYVRTGWRSIDFRLGHRSSMVKNHDRSGGRCWGVNLLLLITSIAGKITCVQPLGHRLPLFRRGWREEFRCGQDRKTSLGNILIPILCNFVTNHTLSFIFLHGCYSYKEERRVRIYTN